MTFKELAAQLSKLQGFTTIENQKLLSKLKNNPFWIWDEQEEHDRKYSETKGNCCFKIKYNVQVRTAGDIHFSTMRKLFSILYFLQILHLQILKTISRLRVNTSISSNQRD
jgi:hypothetical protein